MYEDFYDPRYRLGRRAVHGSRLELHHRGVSPTRFHQNTNTLVMKGSYVRQSSKLEPAQGGGRAAAAARRVRNARPPRTEQAGAHRHSPARDRGRAEEAFPPRLYFPAIAAGYVQNQLERNDLTARTGLRLDLFDARSSVPGDPANPTNDIPGAPTAPPAATTKKFALSPRLGVSWPTGPRSAAHFAYGHFSQFPPIGEIFQNAEFAILSGLQATPEATSAIGVHGQPGHRARAHGSVRSRLQAGRHRGPGRRPDRLLQGHPRPARRRVRLDLQRRGVRPPDQRRLRRRARASRWPSTCARAGCSA